MKKVSVVLLSLNKIEISQIDFAGAGRLIGTDFNQVISDNFCFGKLVDIYFHVRKSNTSLGVEFELEGNQTKLVIFPSDLKNQFSDWSWFSSIDDSNQSLNGEIQNPFSNPASKKTANLSTSSSSNGQKWAVAVFVVAFAVVFFFGFYKYFSKKKKNE